MKVAISTEEGYVSEHFGRCPHFTIIELEGNKITKSYVIENPGHKPGFIPQFLQNQGVNCIICGGMGTRARDLFNEMGIEVILGVTGKLEMVLNQIEKGELKGGESLCKPGKGKGYGVEKTICDHSRKED